MSLPRPSHCCRVINRRLRSPRDSLRIPESALTNASEQCLSRSTVASRRHGSNVPGPLENRRRLGKRHMGELNFGQTHPSAPLWELGNAVDLTKWQWKPPSLFATKRLEQQESEGDRAHGNGLLDWLYTSLSPQGSPVGPSGPVVFDQPSNPAPMVMEDLASTPASLAVYTPDRRSGLYLSRALESSKEESVVAEILAERGIRSLFLDASLDKRMRSTANFSGFCDDLQEVVAEHKISIRTTGIFVRRISQALHEQFGESGKRPSPRTASSFLVLVYTAVLEGLSTDLARHGRRFSYHDESLYSTLLDKISRLNCNTLRLFQRVLSVIPTDKPYQQISNGIASNIHSFLLASSQLVTYCHRGRRHNIIRQINKMADCLAKLDPVICLPVFERVTGRLVARQGAEYVGLDETIFQKMRFCWLHVLARVPKLQDGYLVKACVSLESGLTTEPLSQREICEFFLARLNSRYSVKGMTSLYARMITCPDHGCFAMVCSKLWRTGQLRYIKVLIEYLRRLGRQQDLVNLARGFRGMVKNDALPLANRAAGIGHPQMAFWMFFRYHQSRRKSKDYWNTAFASEALEKLVNNKAMSPQKVLDALGIFNKSRGKSARGGASAAGWLQRTPIEHRTQGATLSKRDILKAGKAAVAFAGASHLSNRVVLRRISQCVQYVQSHNAPVPPQILRALLHVVTRDLAAGRPGRTTRLRWFLHLLLRETNTEQVMKTGLALREWRGLLTQTTRSIRRPRNTFR